MSTELNELGVAKVATPCRAQWSQLKGELCRKNVSHLSRDCPVGAKSRRLKLIAVAFTVVALLLGGLLVTASRLKEFVSGHQLAPAEVQTHGQPAPAVKRKRMVKFSQNNAY